MNDFSSSAFQVLKDFRDLSPFKGKSGKHFRIKVKKIEQDNPAGLTSDLKATLEYGLTKRLYKKLKIKTPIFAKDSLQATALTRARRNLKHYYSSPSRLTVEIYLKNTHPRIKKNRSLVNFFRSKKELLLFSNAVNVRKSSLADLERNIIDQLFNFEWNTLLEIRKQELVPRSLSKVRDDATEVWEDNDAPSLQPQGNDTDPYVGIEIECISKLPKNEFVALLVEKAPLLHKYVRIGYDGSVRVTETHPYSFEFRVLCKQKDVEKVMTRFFETTKDIIKVNSSCGLHVHLDMRNRNFGRSYERLYMSLPVLASMIPASRREGNTYCKLNTNKNSWQSPSDRYLALNPVSYRKYKTLEVRMHSATTNAKKVINWVKLLTLIIDKEFAVNKEGKSLEPQRTLSSLLSFFTKYEVPADLRNYVTQRIAKFGKYKTLSIPKELEAIIPSSGTEISVEQDEQDDISVAM